MSKIEMARQLVRQTAEQERSMEQQRKQELQNINRELASLTQNNGTIIKNQKAIEDCLKYHLDLLIKTRQEISALIKEQKAIRKAQKKIQVIWIITFLTIAIPLLAFWVGWLIYWMFR